MADDDAQTMLILTDLDACGGDGWDRACSHCGYHVCGCGDVRLARTHVHDPGGSYASLLAELPEGYRLGLCPDGCRYELNAVAGTVVSWFIGFEIASMAVEGGTVGELIQHAIAGLGLRIVAAPSEMAAKS